MGPLKLFNRFSVLEIEGIDQEIEDERGLQHESPVRFPQKRTSSPYHRHLLSQKEYIIKKPPFLRIPRELRWKCFDQIVNSITEIEISPSTIDSFHALRLTTKGLREEVKVWAKKRPDIVNDFPYGYYIPSQTTFVLKIDHRWTKSIKHKTVSGSHVTYEKIEMHDGTLLKTGGIDYMTREQAWYSFCYSRIPQKVAQVGLKIQISLSEEFAPARIFSHIPPNQKLSDVLSAASCFVGGPWAFMGLYVRGTLDQLANLESCMDQVRGLVKAIQKTEFDQETWQEFRDISWPDHDYDTLSYPMDIMYWENELYMIYKRDKAGADIYEHGGKVMGFKVTSAEEMRRGPVQSQCGIGLPVERLLGSGGEPNSLRLGDLLG